MQLLVMELYPRYWLPLWQHLGAQGDPRQVYADLQGRYAEKQRHYHILQHLAHCLAEFASARHLAQAPSAVELALWFHDAIYQPQARDNEEQSAALARQVLLQMAMPPQLVDQVAALILLTKQHAASAQVDGALLSDVDLSILGQAEPRYAEYETQIRREYAWVPEPQFVAGRTAVLQAFIDRPVIFQTEWFRKKYESAARVNIMKAIQSLCGDGGKPGKS